MCQSCGLESVHSGCLNIISVYIAPAHFLCNTFLESRKLNNIANVMVGPESEECLMLCTCSRHAHPLPLMCKSPRFNKSFSSTASPTMLALFHEKRLAMHQWRPTCFSCSVLAHAHQDEAFRHLACGCAELLVKWAWHQSWWSNTSVNACPAAL